MKTKKSVSIILLHYNQPNYVKDALESIFSQTYNEIELIFADDCSKDINVSDLKNYCNKNNKNNINIIWQINKKNIGTVKNVNKALSKVSSDYVLIFAADDKLYDKNVISNLVSCFEEQESDVALVSGQCYMMDEKMEKLLYKFVEKDKEEIFNGQDAIGQYKILCQDYLIAMGASMFDVSILKKEKLFDENYKFIEDLSAFLYLTRNNYRFVLNSKIKALLHRHGGISHNNNITKDSVVAKFRLDLVNIMNREVIPYFNIFNYKEKCKVYDLIKMHIKNCTDIKVTVEKKPYILLVIKNLLFLLHRKISYVNSNYKKTMCKHAIIITILSPIVLLLLLLKMHNLINYDSLITILFYVLIGLLLIEYALIFLIVCVKLLYKIKAVKD